MLLGFCQTRRNRTGRPRGRPVFLVFTLLGTTCSAGAAEVHPLVRDVVIESVERRSGVVPERTRNVDPRSPSPAGVGLLRFYGYITCHDLDVPPYRGRWGPDLDSVGSKTTPGWLDRFLENPSKTQPDSKMPRVPLTDQERSDLVAFLSTQAILLERSVGGNAGEGKRLFDMNQCLRCKASGQTRR